MADRVLPGPVDSCANINEAVCIHTNKIFDSCRDKDCIEDLRVYPTASSQCHIDSAFSVRPRCAELLYIDTKIEEICFNRGYYTVDITYFYKIKGETHPGNNQIVGLSVFSKRVILYGSEGDVKIFNSAMTPRENRNAMQPVAVVEAVNPIILNLKLVDPDCCCYESEIRDVPKFIVEAMGEDIVFCLDKRLLLVTLGQFSIVRMERETQLLIPTYSYCFPDKECISSPGEDDPCTLFSKIPFPVDEFFPPDNCASFEATTDVSGCACD